MFGQGESYKFPVLCDPDFLHLHLCWSLHCGELFRGFVAVSDYVHGQPLSHVHRGQYSVCFKQIPDASGEL